MPFVTGQGPAQVSAGTADAVTINNTDAGNITTKSLTTAAGSTYSITLNNQRITPQSIVLATMQLGSSSTGDPDLTLVTAGTGTAVFLVTNRHASAALNGTLEINFIIFN